MRAPPPDEPRPRGATFDLAVVGGGLAGLLGAWRAARERPSARVVVLESSPRAGGAVASERADGFLVETGASTFRPGADAILAVVEELGLAGELIAAQPSARRRFLLRRGELAAVPGSPAAFLASGLLSWRGKLRLLREPFVRAPDAPIVDETVAEFAARRFGPAVVDPLLDALVAGIFAGDPARLEARSAFPRLVALEREHGSVLRGLLREARAKAAARASRPRPRRPLALRGGMQQLVDALVQRLAGSIRTGAPVTRIGPLDGAGPEANGSRGWRVECADGSAFEARELLLAAPATVSARLLAAIDADAAAELAAIESAPVAVAGIGVRREQVGADLRGFGFLAARSEATPLLGVLYESSLFAGRAPDGCVLLRAMLGGDRARLPDGEAELAALAWRETARILRIEGSPRLLHVVRHRPGIPQYRPGHCARLARLEAACARLPGLRLAGWSLRGISLDDRARESLGAGEAEDDRVSR